MLKREEQDSYSGVDNYILSGARQGIPPPKQIKQELPKKIAPVFISKKSKSNLYLSSDRQN